MLLNNIQDIIGKTPLVQQVLISLDEQAKLETNQQRNRGLEQTQAAGEVVKATAAAEDGTIRQDDEPAREIDPDSRRHGRRRQVPHVLATASESEQSVVQEKHPEGGSHLLDITA